MPTRSIDDRLEEISELVLEIAGGNYDARLEPTERGDLMDAVAVGLNLTAESLSLEHARRTRAEARLADEVRAYDEAPAMFCTVDLDNFEIVKCNLTMAKVLGFERDKLLTRRLLGFLAPYERTRADAALRAIAAGETPEHTSFHLRNDEGGHVPVLVSGSKLEEGTRQFRLVLRDVTQERHLASRLQKAQKLEVVGRLASGVAHDFNNTLQVILGAASLLKQDLADDHPGREELDAILKAAEHGSGLTQQLLTLSRPLPKQQAPQHDINRVIRDGRSLLERALGPYNEIVIDLEDAPIPVRVGEGELTQVLLNLAINARDAMPSDGVFTIRSRIQGSDRASLELEDNGIGIPAELLDHVLEPFVTTKYDASGTGLGLSVCKRMVESWGGTLSLQSKVGKGTRATLSLPLTQSIDDPPPSHDAALPPRTRKMVVLVVDDEPLVRNLVTRTLQSVGHEVLSAENVESALELAHGATQIDIVVTDVVMPGGSGADLARALWQTTPDLSVVFMSGYAGNILDSELLEEPNVAFLAKPFVPNSLLTLLDGFGDA